jgi:hypothetical protein
MANRSYLYSSNIEPIGGDSLILTGLSEWNYDIPLLYQILFAGHSALPCKSLVFDIEESSAIYIEYQVALNNLNEFADGISKSYSSISLKSSLDFLVQERNVGKYLVLEPYEIYTLEDGNIESQQESLLAKLKDIRVELLAKDLIDKYSSIEEGVFSIFSKNKKSFNKLEDFLNSSGFSEWSNILCYAPYPPKTEPIVYLYDTEEIVCFELVNTDSYAWFKTIEINRRKKTVLLKEHRNNREFMAQLVSENRDINDRLNFRFNLLPEKPTDLMHVFSLLKDWNAEENCWRLSASSLEKLNGEITLRCGSEIVVYKFIENT